MPYSLPGVFALYKLDHFRPGRVERINHGPRCWSGIQQFCRSFATVDTLEIALFAILHVRRFGLSAKVPKGPPGSRALFLNGAVCIRAGLSFSATGSSGPNLTLCVRLRVSVDLMTELIKILHGSLITDQGLALQ